LKKFSVDGILDSVSVLGDVTYGGEFYLVRYMFQIISTSDIV
jgi:hypothetical protein